LFWEATTLIDRVHTDEDDAEDDHDTRLPSSPVLALGKLVHNRIAGDEGVDGNHFDWSGDGLGCRDRRVSLMFQAKIVVKVVSW
jgi:hypothetical protein